MLEWHSNRRKNGKENIDVCKDISFYFCYDGTAYHGWQIQPNGMSVQETLQNALSTILRQRVEIVGAGRTDTGVHARMMVAHLDLAEEN